MSLTKEQEHIILHSSGLETTKNQYRDYYCCEATNPDLLVLVGQKLMTGPHHNTMLSADHAYFVLTPAGIDKAWELSGRKRPKPKGISKRKAKSA